MCIVEEASETEDRLRLGDLCPAPEVPVAGTTEADDKDVGVVSPTRGEEVTISEGWVADVANIEGCIVGRKCMG